MTGTGETALPQVTALMAAWDEQSCEVMSVMQNRIASAGPQGLRERSA
jgi:hypothetical protein